MGTVARGTGTPPGLTPSAFPCALLPAGPVVWARSRGPPQPCRAGGTLPAVTLGMWPPPGPPSRLDRCCWIDSRTLARLGAPSLPPGSGVGAGAPAWTKPWGLPPPACTQLRTASPPAPMWGGGTSTSQPCLWTPPSPLRTCSDPAWGQTSLLLWGGAGLCPVPPPFTARTCPVPCSVRVLPDPLPVPLGTWGEFLLFS